jgi:hypothetical protein
MKNRTIARVFATLVVAGLFAGCGASKAPEPTSIALPLPADTTAAAPSDASRPTQSAGVVTPIPAATGDVWKAIDKQSADLQAIVQNGALKDVQAKANAIRDLTQALPAHASGLSTDDQAKLQQQVTLVATYVEKLNTASSAGDQAGAKANFVKLNNVLGGMTRFP